MHWHWFLLWAKENELPAWVQAIGSVAAIFFSVQIQRKTALEADAERYSALEGVFTFAYEVARDYQNAWREWISGSLLEPFDKNRIVYADGFLAEVPTFALGNPIAAKLVRDMRDTLAETSSFGWPRPAVPPEASTAKRAEKLAKVVESALGYEALVRASAKKKRHRARMWWVPGA